MAYGEKYRLRFTNRIQNDIWYASFMFKDYTGDSSDLNGSETPITISYTGGDTDPLTPIQAMEINISFLNEGELMLFTSGNADINFTSGVNLITIDDQSSDLGIKAGMVIRIDGVDYNITVVSYNDLFNQIIIQVSQSLIDQSLPAEDFEIYATMGIELFYSDDDQGVRIDVYHETTPSDKLIATGFLIQDGISEAITDFKHVISLKATDNLALLKNFPFNEINQTNFESQQWPLNFFIKSALYFTGLYSQNTTIDLSLPYRSYVNIFENSEDDRADDPVNDPLSQVVIYPQMFKNSDNTWQDCYTVIEQILGDMNCVLFQAEGYWNIVRKPEYQIFDGEIPGTEYIYNGSGTDITAVELDSLVEVARKGDADCYPIEEDQIKTIQRPVKLVQQTFDYNQPPFIIQNDLSLPDGATPFDTDMVGDLRYDKYSIPTYFPDWIQRGGITSYLEVVTDTAVTPENETDRYIVLEPDDSLDGGVQFNPIPVTAGDKFDISLQWRTDTDTNDLIRFWLRFVIISTVDTDYNLSDQAGTGNNEFRWVGPSVSADLWDTGSGLYHEYTNPDDIDTTQWQNWTLSDSQFSTQQIPPIPTDGMLLIEVRGPNSGSQTDRQEVFFKDIRLDFQQFVNESTQIVGHVHTNSGNSLIKAVQETDRTIDDTPRRTIAGTLFTSALTNFDYTDVNTGQDSDIGNIHFTPTTNWHRGTNVEEFKLGEAITLERLIMSYVNRLIIEGTFRNLTIASGYVSPLSLFTFHFAPGRYFTMASMTLDLMNASFNGRFFEIYDNSNLLGNYTFKYIYDNGNS